MEIAYTPNAQKDLEWWKANGSEAAKKKDIFTASRNGGPSTNWNREAGNPYWRLCGLLVSKD